MSGHQPNQPRGWNRNGPPSPIQYRPPSPWAPSPPPIISGPRNQQQYTSYTTTSSPNALSPRSTPMSPLSPMFGNPGLRGSRGPHLPAPRPQWPGPQSQQIPQQHQTYRASPSPAPLGANGPKPYRAPSQPPPSFSPQPYSYSRVSPQPCQTPPEYYYTPPQPIYEAPRYVGVPLEPSHLKNYIIYDEDEEQQGLSTAEIIAAQSQDYVDEKLAEYQLTIAQLQGKHLKATRFISHRSHVSQSDAKR